MNVWKKTVWTMLFLTLTIAVLLCGCGEEKSKKMLMEGDVKAVKTDYSLTYAPVKAYAANEKICSSGITEMYLDTKTYSVAVKNTATGRLWCALPWMKAEGCSPNVFSLEVIYEGKRYVLDSQQNAVKEKGVKVSKDKTGVLLTYTLQAAFEGREEKDTVTVPVRFSLSDGSFFVSVQCGDIVCSCPKAYITKIKLMDYFGSGIAYETEDYFLLPDNCGNMIHPSKVKEGFDNISLKVYGQPGQNNALVGAFGIKRRDDAFAAIIQQGDAIADINADFVVNSKINALGAVFNLRETFSETKNGEEYLYISGKPYSGEIRICYRLLSGNNANYSGMAIVCREQLIRDGVLSADMNKSSEGLPFIASVIATANTGSGKQTAFTTYEQLLDMLTYLKGKGFSNIYVKYRGALNGGLSQNDISGSDFVKALGDSEAYTELTDYMTAQQISFFPEISLVTSASGSINSSNYASQLTGNTVSYDEENSFGVKTGMSISDMSRIEKSVISVFDFAKKNKLNALSIRDVCSFLYSDSSEFATRDDVMKKLKSECSSLSTIGTVMADTGNFYLLKNVSVISSLKTEPSRLNSNAGRAVPFIPLILHGTVDYACEPLNYEGDVKKAMLRAVEYGALPQFEWCYEDIDSADGQKDTSLYSYSNWATDAYSFYEKANKALGDLRASRMTSHYYIQYGVYCSEYGDTAIYVNYTDKAVKIGGVTVQPKDFIRVN